MRCPMTNMKSLAISRRSFLARTGGIAAGLAAFPLAVRASALGKAGRAAAGDRIGVGCIGVGPQGNGVMGGFLGESDCQVIAVCDVKTDARENTKQRVNQHYQSAGCSAFNDFRDLLELDGIDCVSIATCDHWHVLTSLHAAKAGKDVYCEKPMSPSLAECWALREAMHRYGRIFQFGTQQRSDPKFRIACELARSEKIGKLHTINVWSPGSAAGGTFEREPVPAGIDYEMWLGPAPFVPYTKDRCSNRLWWYIADYALGFIAGWGIHPIDIAVWGAGDKIDVPVEIEGKGDFPTEGVCNTAMNWGVTMKYRNGLTINFAGDPRPEEWSKRYQHTESHGTAFEGTDGWVHVHRGIINSNPPSLVNATIGPNDVHLHRSPGSHQRDFLDSVRSRADTACPIDESVRSETLCQISDIAIRIGRKLTWDPKAERFVDDDEANRMLSRTMRSPWRL
jgi:predicted dehydrogenase